MISESVVDPWKTVSANTPYPERWAALSASRSKLDANALVRGSLDVPPVDGPTMRRWLEAVRLAGFIFAVAVGGFWKPPERQVAPPRDSIADVAEVEQMLRDGVHLEQQRRWAEALSHYEDAIRKHPGRRN